MKIGTALLAAITLSACAGPQASGVYETKATRHRLYEAATRAVPSVGYTITSSNEADGVIVAQQGVVLGNGSPSGMNAVVSDDGGVRRLRVVFQAPPLTLALGDYGSNVTHYIGAVQASVPDLRAAR